MFFTSDSMSEVANIRSVAPIGFDGSLIEVESDIKNGLPSLQVVGLGSKAIDEARERIRSAITNSMLDFPAKKLIINLAPAQLPKDGSHYDLPMALSILTSSGQLRVSEVNDAVFAGELALDGSVRPVKAVVSIAETTRQNGIAALYVPTANVPQAVLVEGVKVYGVSSLKELFLHLKGERRIEPTTLPAAAPHNSTANQLTLDDIIGQEQAKRALTIAAAGHHNILFTGSPGAGKTMLARTLMSLLSPLSRQEQVAVTKLHSLAGESIDEVVTDRPFRTPHHTASRVAMIGGGNQPKPGEISLAHHGVLFLDEIPEYPRATLESLRQPLEDHAVSISRANGHVSYPANFMMIATMNPCPCGFYGDERKECSCTSSQILAYQKRLSGPLLDRIDMVISVPRVATKHLLEHSTSLKTQQNIAHKSIQNALKEQRNRYSSSENYNATASSRIIKQSFAISDEARQLLETATEKMSLSARSYFKVLKVSRTIADMESARSITPIHVAEALQYRYVTS